MRTIRIVSSYLLIFIAICSIVYVLQGNNSSSMNNVQEPIESKDLAVITLKDFSNSNFVPINFSEKPTVILFFTSWCPYCNEDAPKIVQLHEKYKDDVNIYGINLIYRDDMQEVKNYIESYQIIYPILIDETGSTYEKYGGSGFPSLYFFNSNGEIIDQIIGSSDIEVIENSINFLQENFII